MSEGVMTVSALARRWDAPAWLVRTWVRRGLLGKPVKSGRRWIVPDCYVRPPCRCTPSMIIRWASETR